MAFERRRGGRYYYHNYRRGGKVRKRYIGAGPAGSLAAKNMAEAKAIRDHERVEMHKRMDQLRAQNRGASELDGQIEQVIRAFLIASGFHQHKRSEWRRRRKCKTWKVK